MKIQWSELAIGYSQLYAVFAVSATWRDSFAKPTNRRQDWCGIARNQSFSLHGLQIREALAGHQMATLFYHDKEEQQLFNFLDYNDGVVSKSLFPDIMDELARRGKFTWQDSFAVISVQHTNASFEEVLRWAVENYDVLAFWVWMTDLRTANGINFLVPFTMLDSSVHLISKPDVNEAPWYEIMFAYLRPFNRSVWLVLLVLLLGTAVAYRVVEAGGMDMERAEHGKNCHSMYLTFMGFWQDSNFKPSTGPGKFLNLSFAFIAVVVLSTYTANLASLLVIDKSFSAPIQSLQEAATRQASVCMGERLSFVGERVSSTVEGLRIRYLGSFEEEYRLLREGDCKVALVANAYWRMAKGKSKFNPDCNLQRVGDNVFNQQNGFVTRAGTGDTKCAQFVAQVLNVLLLEMYNDGFLDGLMKKYLRDVWDAPCPANIVGRSKGRADSLSLDNMGGILGLHFVTVILVVVVHICMKSSEQDCRRMEIDCSRMGIERIRSSGPDVEIISLRGDEASYEH